MPYLLVYKLGRIKARDRFEFNRKLYGYYDYSNYGKYKYFRHGLPKKYKKLTNGVVLFYKKPKGLSAFMKKYKAKYWVFKV